MGRGLAQTASRCGLGERSVVAPSSWEPAELRQERVALMGRGLNVVLLRAVMADVVQEARHAELAAMRGDQVIDEVFAPPTAGRAYDQKALEREIDESHRAFA